MHSRLDKISVTIAPDDTATLTGIDYQDLRSLLTAASLYRHDRGPKIKPLNGADDDDIHENNLGEQLWHLEQQAITDVTIARLKEAIAPGYLDGEAAAVSAIGAHERDFNSLEQDVRELERRAVPTPPPTVDPMIEMTLSLTLLLEQAAQLSAKIGQHTKSNS